MTEPAISYDRNRLLALLAVSALAVGCQSPNFRARELPKKFRTATSANRPSLDLASIASPGSSEAILAPGDLLEVTVATSRNVDDTKPVVVRVADDGMLDVPIVGPVPVAGMEADKASQNIINLAIQRGIYRQPIVTVEIKSKAVNRITVLGDVNEPGVHEIPRGSSDIISALAAAGGLTDEAGTIVEVVRQPTFESVQASADEETSPVAKDQEIQLAAYQRLSQPVTNSAKQAGWTSSRTLKINMASDRPLLNGSYHLNDRDVIRVLSRQKELIFVTGLVSDPGQFELEEDQDIHLLDAIALAGGLSSPLADKVLIIRRVESQPEPVVIQASLSTAKKNGFENLRLAPGDTISVEQTPVTAVADAVSKFFRLSFGVASNAAF